MLHEEVAFERLHGLVGVPIAEAIRVVELTVGDATLGFAPHEVAEIVEALVSGVAVGGAGGPGRGFDAQSA